MNNNEETAKRFLRATAKGYEYAIENPVEAAEILCRAVPEIDIEIAIQSQHYLAFHYKANEPRWGYIDAYRWDAFFGWLGIQPGSGFTNAFLE